jgi:uncharacterized protein (DUF1697 family)
MPRYVALLRGINVGGRNRVAMADLRQLTEALGHTEVATYIQSGNVIFTSSDTDCGALADALEQAIAGTLAVRPAVVVLSTADLAQVIADNPFPDEPNPRCLHAVFRRLDLAPEAIAAVEAAQLRAGAKGSRDEAVPVGRTLFLDARRAGPKRAGGATGPLRRPGGRDRPQLGDGDAAGGHARLRCLGHSEPAAVTTYVVRT